MGKPKLGVVRAWFRCWRCLLIVIFWLLKQGSRVVGDRWAVAMLNDCMNEVAIQHVGAEEGG